MHEFRLMFFCQLNSALVCRLDISCYGGTESVQFDATSLHGQLFLLSGGSPVSTGLEPDGMGGANHLWRPPSMAQHEQAHAGEQRLPHDKSAWRWGRRLLHKMPFSLSSKSSVHRRTRAVDTAAAHDHLHPGWPKDPEDVTLKQSFEQLLNVSSAQGQSCPLNPSGLHAATPWAAAGHRPEEAEQGHVQQQDAQERSAESHVQHSYSQRKVHERPLLSDAEGPTDAKAAFAWPPLGDTDTACRMATLETIMKVLHFLSADMVAGSNAICNWPALCSHVMLVSSGPPCLQSMQIHVPSRRAQRSTT